MSAITERQDRRTRLRSSKPARPNIWRLSILILDMSFDDARVPGQGQAGDHSIPVAFQPCGEGVETGKAVLSDGVEPIR